MKVRTNLCKVVLTIVLLGGSLGLHAEDYDSLQSYNYFFLEGVRQQEMGNLTAAFDLLRHARDLNPNAPEVYYLLAPYYVDLKDDTRSRAYYERAATLDPENSSYIEKLWTALCLTERLSKCYQCLRKLYALNKARVDVLQILYQLYGSQNEFQQMINVLKPYRST